MKAFNVSNKASVYVYSEPIPMYLGFNGLSEVVRKKLKKDPRSGDLFLFLNKKGNYLKVLHWDNGGTLIHQKKLDDSIFDIDLLSEGGQMTIAQLEDFVNDVIGSERGSARQESARS